MRRSIAKTTLALALAALALSPASASALAPGIEKTLISEVTTTSVSLEANVNLHAKTVLYRFEYGPQDCSLNPCATVPGGEGEVKPEDLPVGVEVARLKAPLSGLDPGTSYHFRVVATNGPETSESADRVFMTYLEAQTFKSCANDNLRRDNPAASRIERSSATLPDCRAYERATPIDKDGADATGTVPYARAVLSGGGITFLSSSGVPGGVGSQELPVYLATRGAEGPWSSKGLLPAGDSGQKALVLGWTPDFEAVFARAIKLGNPFMTEFLMTPSGQQPIKIVDYTPQLDPHFAGASEGTAEVLFESTTALPGVTGALEGKTNLYLWEKASEEIVLAGVLNDEAAPPAGAFAGPYDWALGTNPATLAKGGAEAEYYTQEEHAISSDGKAIYFTAAGTGQLYLRKNPTQEQSALDIDGECTEPELACTARVSASEKTNGTIPSGEDPGGPRPAAFMGASADGSAAFFTSSEMLTDDANTGPEQEPAAIERADLSTGGGVVPNLVLTHASDVEVDATNLYWINSETGAIERGDLDGDGAQAIISALDTDNPKGIALSGEQIYWANASGEEGEGTIGRAKLSATGAEEVEPDFIEGAGNPQDVTIGGEFLYWTNSAVPSSNEAYIGRAKAADGSEANAQFVAVFGGETKTLRGLAVDGEHIYWVVVNNGGQSRIHRVDTDGDPGSYVVEFAFLGGGVAVKDVTVNANHIYWTTQTNSLIGRAKLNGAGAISEAQPNWIEGADHPQGIAADATHLYWGSNGEAVPNPGNDLYRYAEGKLSDVSVDSSAFAGADVRGVLGISEDGDYAYFAANGVPDGVGNSPNARGEEAKAGDCEGTFNSQSGSCNLYLWRAGPTSTGTTSFIARLDVAGGEVETDAANWAPTTENIFPTSNFEKTARVSPDGQTLLFRSRRQLTAYESEGTSQLYRYRAGDPGPTCVSCDPTGEGPSAERGLGDVFPSVVVPTNPAPNLSHNLSADGERVFFESTDPLVEADTNGAVKCEFSGSKLQSYPSCLDVYEWEAQGTGTCDAAHAVAEGGCLYLLSTGKGAEPALIADASGEGQDVFFYTRSQLVGQDEDELIDVYDAREEGGLAAQNQPLGQICESTDGCHGPPSAKPPIESPQKFSGPGNPKPKGPACEKPKRKVKGRCVAKHAKAKKHHKKHKANANRRQAR
jgi:hypothetical protein